MPNRYLFVTVIELDLTTCITPWIMLEFWCAAVQGVGAQRVQLVRWCDFCSKESSTHGSVIPPPIVGPSPDMLATIMYTSGTTGVHCPDNLLSFTVSFLSSTMPPP